VKSLDTNIVLRLLLQDVPEQTQKVVTLIDDSKPGSLQVVDAVFFECAWILSGPYYDFDRELIGKMLLQVTAIPQINCNRTMLEKAVPQYAARPALSFIDSCLAVQAGLNEAVPLLTFDRKLAQQLPQAKLL